MANYKDLAAALPTLARATAAPFIDIPNIHNFRGLPGLVGASGRRVRPAYVFRSAEPSPITDEGVAKLGALGIGRVYDLRSASEIERFHKESPVRDIPGTERVATPVLPPAPPEVHLRRMGYYALVGSSGFVSAYTEYLDVGRPAYRTMFEHIRDRPQEGMLVHCSAGKDRTGVFVALIGDLVGVPDDDIAQEYSLTETGLAAWVPVITEVMLQDPSMDGDREKVARALSAKKENMKAFLVKMREVWGGADGYLTKGLDFAAEDVEKIRNNVSEPV